MRLIDKIVVLKFYNDNLKVELFVVGILILDML